MKAELMCPKCYSSLINVEQSDPYLLYRCDMCKIAFTKPKIKSLPG